MMNKLAGVFVIGIAFASNQLTEASTNRIPMSVSEGQSLVERFFAETEFNTGDWGNDISLLLPFKWVSAQDEKYTFFSMAEHKRTYEADWFVEQIVDGRLRHLKYKFSPETDVTFMPQELCEVQYSDGRQCLCYHNKGMRGGDAETDGVGFVEHFEWNELDIGTNGCPQKAIRKGWPEAFFSDETFKSVQSVVPFRFRGPKAEVPQEKDEIRKRLDEYVGTQSGWSMDVTHKNLIVDEHRKHVLENHRGRIVAYLYIVACDVNHDGVCDAYVTSDVEAVGNEKYKWSLYFGTGTGVSRQTESVRFAVNGAEDLYYEADVVVTKADFFRVDRLKMPAYVMVLARRNGLPESWSYMHHENPVRDFRRRKGFANTCYYSCLANGKPGVSSIRDLFLSYYTIVRAERLPCETVNVLDKGSPK